MTEYREFTDEELIERMRLSDEDTYDRIMNDLLERYKGMVRHYADNLYLIGGDRDDLNQEGMIGLYNAIRRYDAEKNDSFSAFASLCIQNKLKTAIESSQRNKNLVLNEAVSLSDEEQNENDRMMMQSVGGQDESNPEQIYISNESNRQLLKKITDLLSPKEKDVFELMVDGMDYRQIAQTLQMSEKAVDNARQRIKKKFEKMHKK